MDERDLGKMKEGGPAGEESSIPGGEGLPPVQGGWTVLYAAPDRVTAIRIQGLMEALGFQVYILEEALGLNSPLSHYPGFSHEPPVTGGIEFSDSHLVVPAAQAEEARKALEVVLRETRKFEEESR